MIFSQTLRNTIYTYGFLFCCPVLYSCNGDKTGELEVEIQVLSPIHLRVLRSPLQIARRMSIDIRGEFLDDSEIQLVLADEGIDTLVDGWLTERASTQLIDIFSSMLLTKVDGSISPRRISILKKIKPMILSCRSEKSHQG